MKIVKPSVEFFGKVPTDYENALAFIEMAGRTCYKSEDKIGPGTAEKFVNKLIKEGHLAMVEHSNFVIKCLHPGTIHLEVLHIAAGKYLNIFAYDGSLYVGGSLTAWYQSLDGWGFDDFFDPLLHRYSALFGLPPAYANQPTLQVCPHNEIPKELHRYSAKFICDRGVSHELVRHRPCSFAQESTRYCNYSGKDMEFIEPVGFDDWDMYQEYNFKDICSRSEKVYGAMLRSGLKPQQARAVLPNALKTEIVVTADIKEWAHIKNLRTSPAAHPDIQRVMNMMPWEEFL